jgi:16S rRNA (guanine(527)-N(7))-methyltransferase RsmG
MPSQAEILKAIHTKGLPIDEQQAVLASQFGEILYRENKEQNLTRILGAEEFVEGHLVDVIELLSLPTIGNRVLDIGSGSGVPGLLSAALSQKQERVWFLTESEGKKAEYLEKARQEMGLDRVSVFARRAEEVINLAKPDTVIARAVGTVDKLAGWIWNCSTWNNLILFKSRGWEKEWTDAQQTKFGKKLTVIHMHDYSAEGRTRTLVTLKRK